MATPIRIKRSAVAGKKPTDSQLQLGELAVNFYDGKIFLKQDQGGVGIGTRIVEVGAGTTTFAGKTLFVTQNGNDDNDGLNETNAKATIKAAVALAVPRSVFLDKTARPGSAARVHAPTSCSADWRYSLSTCHSKRPANLFHCQRRLTAPWLNPSASHQTRSYRI